MERILNYLPLWPLSSSGIGHLDLTACGRLGLRYASNLWNLGIFAGYIFMSGSKLIAWPRSFGEGDCGNKYQLCKPGRSGHIAKGCLGWVTWGWCQKNKSMSVNCFSDLLIRWLPVSMDVSRRFDDKAARNTLPRDALCMVLFEGERKRIMRQFPKADGKRFSKAENG